ncbi:MAG TPA: ABC transporter ATP-binding protein [Chitinophagaceae bacterium]|nr:ABC transporter ATP-binding protein [Chitinophagaceae bacterium]
MTPIIEVEHLGKRFSDFTAVDDLSFTVNQGDVYGFLGQNGAGKSTTIRMLLTLIAPTAGRIKIFGKDIMAARNEILNQTGAVIERPDLYKYLTAKENLAVFARLSGIRPTETMLMKKLDQVGLADRALSKVKTFSQGMKQRLGIAVALVHDPSLIILDEPTNGLDPQGIADMRNLIISLSRDQGKTVLVSSHLLSEMEQMATRMIIIDKGRKIVEGDMKELLDPSHVLLEIKTVDQETSLNWIRNSSWGQQPVKVHNGAIQIRMERKDISSFSRELMNAGADIIAINPRNSLEEYFLTITGRDQYAGADQDRAF